MYHYSKFDEQLIYCVCMYVCVCTWAACVMSMHVYCVYCMCTVSIYVLSIYVESFWRWMSTLHARYWLEIAILELFVFCQLQLTRFVIY